jgi:hypothetical protein
MRTPGPPIFVMGSLRSGASLLTWSLGQHPSILPLLDNSWLETFAGGLGEAYAAAVRKRAVSQLDIMGVEIEDFYAYFGEGINRLLLSKTLPAWGDIGEGSPASPGVVSPVNADGLVGPTRWIDNSPTNCSNVVGLWRLFPEAKFIHVLRDVGGVVEALTNEEKRSSYRSHWRRYTEEAAYGHWLETVRACVEAEHAFGSATVLRVRRDEMVGDPEATLRRCLAFVGESFVPACLRPFE